MFAQLQQNQILLQKLVQPRHHDPVLSALDGGSASGGGSGSGVRGCMARDVFVRSMSDLSRILEDPLSTKKGAEGHVEHLDVEKGFGRGNLFVFCPSLSARKTPSL